jgi:dolichyl-phosphate-mannose-protein mannosyltransferase
LSTDLIVLRYTFSMNFNWKRITIICLGLFIVTEVLFQYNILYPSGPNFDEVQYVPASKAFLDLKGYRNTEHPPLAKEIMALGIAIYGDNQYGWRLMSTIFGSLTLVGIFMLSLALFKDESAAFVATGLTLFNQLLYVQSRIAMLDTFMASFLIWALAVFAFSAREKMPRKTVFLLWSLSGLFFGLSLACKWTALFALLPTIAIIPFAQRFKKLNLWSQNPLWHVAVGFLIVPIIFYSLTFIPVCMFSDHVLNFFDLPAFQLKMYDLQTRVVGGHPYLSHWTSWPFMKRPIWYAFDKDGPYEQYIRGVIMLGNPLIMWGGLIALVACVYKIIYKKENYLAAFFIVYYYCCLYFCWAVFPRKVAFFYYYYPAAFMLGLAITYVVPKGPIYGVRYVRWWVVGISACLFLYFMPILGAFQIGKMEFLKWMWFRSWI